MYRLRYKSFSVLKLAMMRKGTVVGGWRAALMILSMEICERLATLGIALNLVTYLHDQMNFTIPTAANTVTNFVGTSFILCLLGGFIADSYLGRYGTILAGTCFQLIGMIMMVISSLLPSLRPKECHGEGGKVVCEPPTVQHQAVLYVALYMIAVGTGGIKSCVSGLGAEQWEEDAVGGRQNRQSFFNFFGVGLSLASILAATLLAYVQDNLGHGLGFTISAACTASSILLFLVASPFYHTTPPSGSPLSFIARIFLAAWHNRHLPPPPLTTHYLSATTIRKLPTIHHTNQFLFLDKAALEPQLTESNDSIQSTWILSSLEGVEEVKMFLRLFPILATTIIFWTVNAQMVTFSVEQAATLDRRLGGGFEVPPASFNAIVHVTTIITLPLYDRILLPLARKWRKNEYGITSLQRIGIGLIFCTLSMVVAGLVERKRLHLAQKSSDPMMPMSALYLIPQYALVGLGDAFGYIGQIDFFFGESPSSMRSLGTGLCLSALSLGFFLSGALVSCINKLTKHGSHDGWLTNNLNDGRLDNFYYFLAVCSFVSFLAFLICSNWYIYNHSWSKNHTSQLEEGAKCHDKK